MFLCRRRIFSHCLLAKETRQASDVGLVFKFVVDPEDSMLRSRIFLKQRDSTHDLQRDLMFIWANRLVR